MTTSTKLPSVLQAPIAANSLAMERSLKQILELLEQADFQFDTYNQMRESSIDDINTMLSLIDRD